MAIRRFPFDKLSTELALEVIRYAASPIHNYPFDSPQTQKRYAHVLTLSRVSHAFRHATMPYLLHTIALSNDTHVKRFVEALRIQRRHHLTSSRLSVDYRKYVRRLWMSECCGSLEDSLPEDGIEYDELFILLRNADIGFNTISIGSFYNILGSSATRHHQSLSNWPLAKKRLTLCGSFLRWRPLTSTREGHAFLAVITHLVLWVSYTNKHAGDELLLVQEWFKSVPFELMPNLSHFAVSLPRRPGLPDTRMLVCKIEDKRAGAETFKEWRVSSDPFKHGVIVPFYVDRKGWEEDWEDAYFRGEDEAIWDHVDLISSSA